MPNWCSNKLLVCGPVEDIARFKEKARGHSPWIRPEETPETGSEQPHEAKEANALNFHSLVPVPEELLTAGYNEAAYHWELEHWGCKWGACETQVNQEEPSCLLYEFGTAWSPPLPFLKATARQWPRLSFVLEYDEPGTGLKGLAKAHGEEMENLCVDY